MHIHHPTIPSAQGRPRWRLWRSAPPFSPPSPPPRPGREPRPGPSGPSGGAASAPFAAADASRPPEASPARTSTTSARPAAACGRPPTAAPPGGRSPTARSPSASVGAVRGRPVQPRRRLHRHGRDAAARQHHPGRRRLQDHGRRQDLDALGADGQPDHLAIRVHPTNPDLVYVAVLRPRLPDPTRSAASSGRRTAARPGRRSSSATTRPGPSTWLDRSERPERALRDPVGGVPDASHMMSSGGPGSGIFKSTDGGDTWTEISRNPGLPEGRARQDRRLRVRRRLEPRLRPDRGRGRRLLQLRRRGGDLDSSSPTTATFASAPSTTRASTPTRRRRTPSTC